VLIEERSGGVQGRKVNGIIRVIVDDMNANHYFHIELSLKQIAANTMLAMN
jgi:hypothetical protein